MIILLGAIGVAEEELILHRPFLKFSPMTEFMAVESAYVGETWLVWVRSGNIDRAPP